MILLDIRHNALPVQEGTDHPQKSASTTPTHPKIIRLLLPRLNPGRYLLALSGFAVSIYNSVPLGELPPPPPRACFGREELIEKIVGLAENLDPIALIGVGGIGKTSVALAALHSDRIKQRF